MDIQAVRTKVHAFSRWAEWLTVSMFIGIFVLFVVSVFQRYVLVQPVNWVDESILILFLWSTFLTEALVLSNHEQVTFDVIWDQCGPQGRRTIGLVAAALIALLFALSAPTIWGYVAFLWREKTNALEWRLDHVYFCFVIYWLAVIVRAVDRIFVLSSDQWSEHVKDQTVDEKTNVLG
ncbi:MAG: TRAP transporter small permease subunit [Betaproteobacteria bacterium]|nr:TRAP transporter small permease subunit [Betaproteobacteria bacterium]